MKKLGVLLTLSIVISLLLIGCSKQNAESKEEFGFNNTQKIEVSKAENPEKVLNVIDKQEVIKEFTEILSAEKWRGSEIPSEATEDKIFKIYQTETDKLGEAGEADKSIEQVGEMITYDGTSYLRLKANGLNLSFEVPEGVAAYLSDDQNFN